MTNQDQWHFGIDPSLALRLLGRDYQPGVWDQRPGRQLIARLTRTGSDQSLIERLHQRWQALEDQSSLDVPIVYALSPQVAHSTTILQKENGPAEVKNARTPAAEIELPLHQESDRHNKPLIQKEIANAPSVRPNFSPLKHQVGNQKTAPAVEATSKNNSGATQNRKEGEKDGAAPPIVSPKAVKMAPPQPETQPIWSRPAAPARPIVASGPPQDPKPSSPARPSIHPDSIRPASPNRKITDSASISGPTPTSSIAEESQAAEASQETRQTVTPVQQNHPLMERTLIFEAVAFPVPPGGSLKTSTIYRNQTNLVLIDGDAAAHFNPKPFVVKPHPAGFPDASSPTANRVRPANLSHIDSGNQIAEKPVHQKSNSAAAVSVPLPTRPPAQSTAVTPQRLPVAGSPTPLTLIEKQAGRQENSKHRPGETTRPLPQPELSRSKPPEWMKKRTTKGRESFSDLQMDSLVSQVERRLLERLEIQRERRGKI